MVYIKLFPLCPPLGAKMYCFQHTTHICSPMGMPPRTPNQILRPWNPPTSGKQNKSITKSGYLYLCDTRGWYARICTEVPLEKPLKIHIHYRFLQTSLIYEGLNLLCTKCGRLGYASWNCQITSTPPLNQLPTTSKNTSSSYPPVKDLEPEWKIVSFPKKPSFKYI